MEKSVKVLLLVTLVIALLIGAAAGILIVSASNKPSLTPEDFASAMEELGYTIYDTTEEVNDESVEKGLLAGNSDESYYIEYYDMISDQDAIDLFYGIKTTMEAEKGSVSSETNVGIGNNAKYTLTSNGSYAVVSRINDTVVCTATEDTYKDEIQTALKTIGY